MEGQLPDVLASKPRVKATLCLGSEKFSVCSGNGILSEQLISMKEESMAILNEYITKHNSPYDVPGQVIQGSSDESEEDVEKPLKKPKIQG